MFLIKKKIDNKCKLLFMHRIKDKVCSKDLLGPPNFDAYCTFVGIERVKHCKEVLLEVQWSFKVHQHYVLSYMDGLTCCLTHSYLPRSCFFFCHPTSLHTTFNYLYIAFTYQLFQSPQGSI